MMCNPHKFSFAGRVETASYRNAKPNGPIEQDHQLALTSRSIQCFPGGFGMRSHQARARVVLMAKNVDAIQSTHSP